MTLWRRAMTIPLNAWRYSQQKPLEAFLYAGAFLVAAYFARVVLAFLALVMMGGALYRLIRRGSPRAHPWRIEIDRQLRPEVFRTDGEAVEWLHTHGPKHIDLTRRGPGLWESPSDAGLIRIFQADNNLNNSLSRVDTP